VSGFITDIRWRDRVGATRKSPVNCLLARSLRRNWDGSWAVTGATAVHLDSGDVYSHGLRGWLTVVAFDNRLPAPFRRVRLRQVTGLRASLARAKVRRKSRIPLPRPARARGISQPVAQRVAVPSRTITLRDDRNTRRPAQPRLQIPLPPRHVSKPQIAPAAAPVLVSKPGPALPRPQGVRNGQDADQAGAPLARR
jgi:hypothetical protein